MTRNRVAMVLRNGTTVREIPDQVPAGKAKRRRLLTNSVAASKSWVRNLPVGHGTFPAPPAVHIRSRLPWGKTLSSSFWLLIARKNRERSFPPGVQVPNSFKSARLKLWNRDSISNSQRVKSEKSFWPIFYSEDLISFAHMPSGNAFTNEFCCEPAELASQCIWFQSTMQL